MAASSETVCIEEYKKYEDTVAVTIALSQMVSDKKLGSLFGLSRKILTNEKKEIRPDVTFRCTNKESSALFFEFKWSVTPSSIRGELEDIERYRTAAFVWSDGLSPAYNDVVLVVNEELAPIAKKAMQDLFDSGDRTLEDGFAIWSWRYSVPRRTEEGGEPTLFVQQFAGHLNNSEVEPTLGNGYRLSEKDMTVNRQKYLFIPDKPPVQYTIIFLLLNVLSGFYDAKEKKTEVELNEVMLDVAYDRAKELYLGWSPEREESSQVARAWLKEAFTKMGRIGMEVVSLPFKPRRPPLEYICDKLGNPPPTRIGKTKRLKSKRGVGTTLDRYLNRK